MKATTLSVALAVTLIASGCASTNYEPVLDGVPNASYTTDLTACQTLANEHQSIDSETKKGTLLGAGVGAVLGAADDDSDDAEGALAGAAIGAAVGAGAAFEEARERNREIVVACMQGRGHRVVG